MFKRVGWKRSIVHDYLLNQPLSAVSLVRAEVQPILDYRIIFPTNRWDQRSWGCSSDRFDGETMCEDNLKFYFVEYVMEIDFSTVSHKNLQLGSTEIHGFALFPRVTNYCVYSLTDISRKIYSMCCVWFVEDFIQKKAKETKRMNLSPSEFYFWLKRKVNKRSLHVGMGIIWGGRNRPSCVAVRSQDSFWWYYPVKICLYWMTKSGNLTWRTLSWKKPILVFSRNSVLRP